MTKEQIKFLLNAGFTMDEIMAQFAAPAPNPEPAPAPNPEPAPAPLPASLAEIENTMNEIAAMLRTGALAAQFGPPTPDRGVSDILAEVINPPRRNAK